MLAEYDAVVLGNVACMSAAARQTVRDFVAAGGGLHADFESGMYDERSRPADDAEWRRLLGIGAVEGMFVPSRTEDYFKVLDTRRPLGAFRPGQLLPRPAYVLQVRPAAKSVAPAVVTVPLGKSYMVPQGDTDWPAFVLSRYGKGRAAYCPGALSAAFDNFGMLQHQQLIETLVRSVLPGKHPLAVAAPPYVYVEWRRQGPATDLVHLVNNTGDMHRPVGAFVPVRGIRIGLARESVTRVRSLRLGKDLPFRFSRGMLRTRLPVLEQYDVVVVE